MSEPQAIESAAPTETPAAPAPKPGGPLTIRHNDDGGAPEGIEKVGSVEERASMLLDALGAAAMTMQDPDEVEASDVAPAPKAAPGAAPAPAPAQAAEAPAAPETPPTPPAESERAKRFAQLRAQERAKLEQQRRDRDFQAKIAEVERMAQAVQEERKLVEPLLRAIKGKDLMALNEIVSEHFAPDDVAAAIPKWTSDEQRAKWRENKLKSEALSEAQKEINELKKLIEEAVIAPQRQKQQQEHVEGIYRQFADVVKAQAEHAPYSSTLLERDKDALFALADATANLFLKSGKPYTLYDIINHIERKYATGTAPATPNAPPSAGQSASGNAAAKATTVTNRHAAAQTTVVEDETPEGESLDDRIKRLTRQWSGVPLQPKR